MPDKVTLEGFDPDEMLMGLIENKHGVGAKKKFSQIPYDYERPGVAPSIVNFLRTFGSAATAGLSEKAGAGLSALGAKYADVTGVAPEGEIGSLGEEYKGFLSRQEGSLEDYQKKNPMSSGLATVLGLISPGGMFSMGMKGAGKIPAVSKLLESGKFGERLVGAFLRGGTANALYGQGEMALDPDSKLQDIPTEAATDFAVGGTLDAGIMGVGEKGLRPAWKGVKRWAQKWAPERLPAGIGDAIKEARAEKFTSQVKDIAKTHGVDDPLIAGRSASEKGAALQKEASEKYLKLKGAMLKKFGEAKVSAETLRHGIEDELVKITELTADLDPDARALKPVLEKWQARLYKNPTLTEIDDITTTLYDLKNKANANPAFGRLYKASRDNLLKALDDAAVYSGESSKAYRGAVSEADELAEQQTKFMTEKSELAKSVSDSKRPISKIVSELDAARAYQSNAESRAAQKMAEMNVTKLEAELAAAERASNRLNVLAEKRGIEVESAQKAVSKKQKDIEEIINSLDSENAEAGEAAREAYRSARQEIAKSLKLKEGPVGKLIQIGSGAKGKMGLPSDVPSKARTIGKLDRPEVVDEALSVNPEYRDVMRKAVLGDVMEKATTPKRFEMWLEKYKHTLPKLFSTEELAQINKVAGVGKKSVSWLSKMTGVSTEPGIAEILPRTIAPLISN